MIKHKENLNPARIGVINTITLLLGFSTALTTYIISSYIKEVTGSDNVTIFYIASYILILIALFNLQKITKTIGEFKNFILSIVIFALSSLILYFLPVGQLGILFMAINIIASTLCFAEKDALLESCSTDKMSGRIRGLHLTLMNFGFIFAPFISMWLLSKYEFKSVFILQFAIVFLILIFTYFGLKKTAQKENEIFEFKQNLWTRVNKNKDILRIYYISFVLDLFYFFAVVFIPIYLRNIGMSWEKIGLAFTIMLLPFVLIQYPIGILADKKFGEKEMLIASLLILAFSSGGLIFIDSTNIYLWSAALFATRIGAASIEMLRDSYFYKKIDGRDIDLINFFRTTNPLAYIIGAIIAGVSLLVFPLSFIFILIFAISLSGLWPAIALRDSQSEAEEAVRVA